LGRDRRPAPVSRLVRRYSSQTDQACAASLRDQRQARNCPRLLRADHESHGPRVSCPAKPSAVEGSPSPAGGRGPRGERGRAALTPPRTNFERRRRKAVGVEQGGSCRPSCLAGISDAGSEGLRASSERHEGCACGLARGSLVRVIRPENAPPRDSPRAPAMAAAVTSNGGRRHVAQLRPARAALLHSIPAMPTSACF